MTEPIEFGQFLAVDMRVGRVIAVEAARLVGAKTVIPVHYDTFPPIETDAEAFKADVERETDSTVVILAPGETHTPA